MNWGFDRLGWIRRVEFTAVVAVAIALALRDDRSGRRALRRERDAVDGRARRRETAKAETHGAPIFNTIDYATTGSIKGQTVVISPCTRKSRKSNRRRTRARDARSARSRPEPRGALQILRERRANGLAKLWKIG